jgi:2-keto-4-pentenoate hydratase/2-oxohepta-3-ene-1,7-dioic acid hydratase in catechol pathway
MKVIRFLDEAGIERLGTPAEAGTARLIEGELFGRFEVTERDAVIKRYLPPVDPPNVIGIGLNYRAHAEESGAAIPAEPVVFVKLNTAVTAAGEPIVLPAQAGDEVDYEAELAVIIGRTARNVSEGEALEYVLGYSCANDVSARDCQLRRDQQWARGKSFDTFCPLGPELLIDREVQPGTLGIRTYLNGELMQDSTTGDLIFSVEQLVSFLSRQFTLRPGTVILTGTPPGVGFARKPARFLRDSDEVTVEIEKVGKLTNPVLAEKRS